MNNGFFQVAMPGKSDIFIPPYALVVKFWDFPQRIVFAVLVITRIRLPLFEF